MILQDIIQFFNNYSKQHRFGIVSLIIDSCLVLIILGFIIYFFLKRAKKSAVLFMLISYVIIFTIIILLDLQMILYLALLSVVIIMVMICVYYAPEVRHVLSSMTGAKVSKSFLVNPETKEELINTLIKTVDHLSTRSIGAIITIEKEHTLNVYIDKAVKLDANVTFELLDTIFHPNTALHDGAVIIRGNHIMCAGAFFPSSDKNDIPQQFGSRHRAAIGISEVTDAFTVVVSEETGNIATTIGGTISANVSLESLRVSLNQHILVQ